MERVTVEHGSFTFIIQEAADGSCQYVMAHPQIAKTLRSEKTFDKVAEALEEVYEIMIPAIDKLEKV